MRKKILQVQKKKGGGETLSLARSLSPSLALSEAGGLPSHPTPPPNLSLLPGSASFQPQANQCLQVTSEAGEALQEGGGGGPLLLQAHGGGGCAARRANWTATTQIRKNQNLCNRDR